MSDYDASTYGEHMAAFYDQWVERLGVSADTDPAVTFLAGVAGGGRVLELGVGTGRIAAPLAARGLEVHGIDASPSMVAKLRAKPGGQGISVTIGDFAEVDAGGTFSLVFVVFNTFFALPSQDAQVRCFTSVARRLAAGGAFVLEAFVPDLSRFSWGQATQTTWVGMDAVALEASRHDPVGQRVTSAHVVLSAEGVRVDPVRVRYAWPAELDLMARLAGLRLRERFGGWGREPFGATSTRHVSVYEPAGR
jgi:SAM-dependent methyltransferase